MNSGTFPRRVVDAGLFLFALSLPISHVPAQVGIGLSVLGWLLEGVVNKRWHVRWHVLLAPLMFYIAWNSLSALASERPSHSLSSLLDNEWPLLIMLMLYWTVDTTVKLRNLVYTFLASSSVAMVYAIWQSIGGVELYRGMPLDPMGWGFYRAVGFYGFYLTFAALAMVVFLFAIAFMVEQRGRNRWVFGACAVVSFLAVVGTFARSIWLSFAAAIPLFAFSRGRKAGIIVMVGLVGLVTVGILTTPALRYRAESIFDFSQNQTRLNLWKTAARIAADHPVIGVGEDNWDLMFERYRVEGYYDTTVHPHNDYLGVLVSSGFPGLTAFLAIWGIALAVGFRSAQRARDVTVRAISLGSTFSLLGFLVGALFQNYYGTFVNCLGWWFVVGLLFAADRLRIAEGERDAVV